MNTSIVEDLRLATPDVGARRTFIIWEAERAERLDPMTRAELLEHYASPDVANVSGLFTDLTEQVRRYTEVRDYLADNFIDPETGATKGEELDRIAEEIARLAEELVPSRTVYVADNTPLTSLDEPQGADA